MMDNAKSMSMTLTASQLVSLLKRAHKVGENDMRRRLLEHVQNSGQPVGSRTMRELLATQANVEDKLAMPSGRDACVLNLTKDAVMEAVGKLINEVKIEG